MRVSRVMGSMKAVIVLLTLLAMSNLAAPNLAAPNLAAPQRIRTLLATAHGQGTLTVGQEEFKVTEVVVKLKDDDTGEITVVTDLQLFFTCTWSPQADPINSIDLKITGGTNAGTTQGSGKLLLRADGKSIARLSLEGTTSAKRKFQLQFVAE